MKRIKRAEIVEVIRIRQAVGEGTPKDPVREVVQYWEKTGKMIAEMDTYEESNFSASKTANSAST